MRYPDSLQLFVGCLGICSASALTGRAAPVYFTDDFTGGASAVWLAEFGSWKAVDGVYRPTFPGNFPNANSGPEFELVDTEFEVDVHQAVDGGLWLHSSPAPGTAVGRRGVLLVFARGVFYWHVVQDGSSYGASLSSSGTAFVAGESSFRLRVTSTGSSYAAYLDGSPNPVTTLNSSLFSHGQVALYAYGSQTFDNVRVGGSPWLSLAVAPQRVDAEFVCRVVGPPTVPYRIEASADFKQWVSVRDGVLIEGLNPVAIPVAADSAYRFYRAVTP